MQKMPCKKKKYNSRFPPARIKKIMQSDDEVGKVAAVVPIIISRVLEIFVENLLKDSCRITRQRNARTLTPAHIKASILQNNQLDFLKEIVSLVPDIQTTSGDEQIDFNHSTYADYYSSNNAPSNNHPKFIKQFSHPAGSQHNPMNVAESGSLGIDHLDLNKQPSLIASTAHAFQFNSNKRFKNTYSRSNSAPCTTTLINTDELRNRKKANRLRQPESTAFEDDLDEEDELDDDESLTDDSNDNHESSNPTTPCTSAIGKQANKSSKNKLELIEDDDYDA